MELYAVSGHERVVALNLQGKGLVGTLSPSIGNLSFLHVINLGSNNIQDEIPEEIGKLFRLQVLNLSSNSFGGEIPTNLSHCTNLKLLNLVSNGFVGKLPSELSLNTNLRILTVASNNFTGSIPPSFGNLSSLAYLVLMINNLEGNIPFELGQITSLNWLQLAGNKLSGVLPSSLYNLTSTSLISVAGNQLHGSISPNIGLSFPNLQWLSIGGNHFTGNIPFSLSNITKLLLLDFSQNRFVGPLPLSLGNLQYFQWLNVGQNRLGDNEANDLSFIVYLAKCSHLRVLGLDDNNFGGILPNSITNLSTQLTTLTIGGNHIYGSIPTGIANLVNLTQLGMGRNMLSGIIPSGIGNLQNLQELTLSRNRISGQIPVSFGNISILSRLLLDGNSLEGNVPPSLGNCEKLLVLNLSYNSLSGNIPEQILNLTYLAISLNLAHNILSGSLPQEVGNLINLGELDISGNKFSGEIPETLGNCLTLERLYMERNSFEGIIPQSLSALKGLQVLDLSQNNLTGQIPKYLENLPLLQHLNISFNNFDGEVPKEGVFNNASATSIIGNGKLCGGIPAFQLPSCPVQATRRHRRSSDLKVIVLVVTGVTCTCLIVTLFTIFYLLRRSRKKLISSSSPEDQVSRLSYMKLFKATEGFSLANLVGQGRYGSVYRGTLDDEEKEVAVKVFNLSNHRATKSFMTECKALKTIRHRNLVKIITSCSSEDFKALVFEFMPNGSLERWLHSEGEQEHQLGNLNFIQRLNIAIDVASALEYLHLFSHTPIIHCDLKPSNILLDSDMTAHVGDFGLAKLLTESTESHASNQTSSSCIKGTIGYVAPEYGMGSEVSTYGDVYSYGILLLEMFTGKRPTDEIFKNGLSLHEFAKVGLADHPLKVVDSLLLQEREDYKEDEKELGNSEGTERNKWEECFVMVMKLGIMCSMESPKERRDMRDVAKEMQVIRTYFLGSTAFRYARRLSNFP